VLVNGQVQHRWSSCWVNILERSHAETPNSVSHQEDRLFHGIRGTRDLLLPPGSTGQLRPFRTTTGSPEYQRADDPSEPGVVVFEALDPARLEPAQRGKDGATLGNGDGPRSDRSRWRTPPCLLGQSDRRARCFRQPSGTREGRTVWLLSQKASHLDRRSGLLSRGGLSSPAPAVGRGVRRGGSARGTTGKPLNGDQGIGFSNPLAQVYHLYLSSRLVASPRTVFSALPPDGSLRSRTA
jgi:hypothetical protein